MICRWQELLWILPVWLRAEVDRRQSFGVNEIRLRLHSPPEIICQSGGGVLNRLVTAEDLTFCLNAATKYSPWTSGDIQDGFVTAPGGHRIGVCGECVQGNEGLKNINIVTSVCIRVAKDFTGLCDHLQDLHGSVLIIGKPGSGKTTFLRDLVRCISKTQSVTVIDERRELFPVISGQFAFDTGMHTHVMSGCKKTKGLEMAIRTMSPDTVAVDEITAAEDCAALEGAAWCGVRILATAHAGSKNELFCRKIYQPLLQNKIFETLIILQKDKSYRREEL